MTELRLHKYYCSGKQIAGIKANGRNRQFSTVCRWVEVAKADISGLKDEDIRIVQYSSDRWINQLGIEFPCSQHLEGYTEVQQLEQAFS